MEQKNLFIAIILSMLVFFVWNSYFIPENNDLTNDQITEKEVFEKPANEPITFDTKSEDKQVLEQKEIELKTTTIKTPLYEVKILNKGAVFTSLKLHEYKEENNENSELKELINNSLKNGTFEIFFKNKNIRGIENAIFVPDNSNSSITANNPTKITYSWVSEDGVVVEKIFEFLPETYLINYNIVVKNGSDKTVEDKLLLSLKNKLSDVSQISFEGPTLFIDTKSEEIKPGNIEDTNYFKGNIDWIAIQDRYFMTSIIPNDSKNLESMLFYDENNEIIDVQIATETGQIIPGTQKIFEFKIFAGPKCLSTLKSIGFNIDKIVNFGWFDFIAKPCLMLMNYIHDKLNTNYGIAIILLTILFKIIFWPLGTKSYKSMNDMKKLQPLVAEIREKFKDNKQKMNEEMMGLYKTYKVNPLSGCLPMVVQMPIFFAFYRMLYSAIELRHAPFFGWITDLSAPDRLFDFNFVIPFYEPPTGIPVLTLLMGGSMFLQQKMSPPAGDPTQAKMMLLMPVFMTFIFMNFSSGLVLYWLVNNVISISQQYYIMKKNA